LVVATRSLTLNYNLFSLCQQRQENIDINIIVSQMTDRNTGGACLCGIIPNDVSITRISAGSTCIGAIQEQI
jgi:hypothetical protein